MEEQTSSEKEQENKTEEPKTEENSQGVGNDVKDNKWWALLSYLGVLVIIPLLAKRDSEFAQFHVKQGLVLLAGWVLSWLPFGPIIGLIAFVFSIVGIINVLSGEKKKLPLIGDLADKIKL